MTDWLTVIEGNAPIIIAMPHIGAKLADVESQFQSPWLARRDADWWIDKLYDFAQEMGATLISTQISRSVIDLNRDPSGASLYPGQATTELCPTMTFDGEPLYASQSPDEAEIARRRDRWFTPYHAAIEQQIARLKAAHPRIILYDAHSIRSHVPRLFEGELPQFNIGTNDSRSCAIDLEKQVAAICSTSGESHVVNGRFKGGWTTRHYGNPSAGIHAIQMELAIRGYMDEPPIPTETNWPPVFDTKRASALTLILKDIIKACIAFAEEEA